MSIFGRSPRRALRLGGTFALLALYGCNGDGCSDLSPPDVAAQDARLRAALAQSGPTALPAKGDILIVGGGTSVAASTAQSTTATEFYSVAANRFVNTGSLVTSRVGTVPVVVTKGALANGVLIAGGASGSANANNQNDVTLKAADLKSVERFNPRTGKSTVVVPLSEPRSYYAATALLDGTILYTGGISSSRTPLSDAELFDPITRKFTTLSMNYPRAMHTATLLTDGTVLVAGGLDDSDGDSTGTAEIYDPKLHVFRVTKGTLPHSMTIAGQTAILISGCKCANDGKVLLAGGFNGSYFDGGAVESTSNLLVLYNPTTETFANTASQLIDDRFGHSATLLANGDVLLAGGISGQAEIGGRNFGITGTFRNSAELFEPATGHSVCIKGVVTVNKIKTCAASMVAARFGHVAAMVHAGKFAGKVLLAGGAGDAKQTNNKAVVLKSAEFFNPATKSFAAAGASLNSPHFGAVAVIAP